MKAVLVNYNYDPTWLKDYDLDVVLYDRSDDQFFSAGSGGGQLLPRDLTQYGEVYKTKNLGDVDFDKLSWLVDNYDTLPEVFLWSKTNIFKFVDEKDLKKALKNKVFQPLLKYDHKIYSNQFGEVNKYIGTAYGKMYAEANNSWYFHAGLDSSGRFKNWNEWARTFHLPVEPFIPFAPGGSYILTRERVHRYAKDLYAAMCETLPYAQRPVEAHCCERSYFYLWS